MADFTNKLNLEIELDWKAISEDGSTFYRFTMLDGEVIFWFSLHDNKDIYSIGVTAGNLFPVSGTTIYAFTTAEAPFYFDRIAINPSSLNGDIYTTQRYIEELQLACAIGLKIEQFFRTEFLQKYAEK